MNGSKRSFICTYVFTAIEFLFKGVVAGLFFTIIGELLWKLEALPYSLIVTIGTATFDIARLPSVIFAFSYFVLALILVWKSRVRLDFACLSLLGILCVWMFKDYGLVEQINSLTWGYWQFVIILAMPIIFMLMAFVNYWYLQYKKINSSKNKEQESDSLFRCDKEIETENEDILNVVEKAKVFADQVCHQNSKDSLICGVEAPWGTGKTSFLNLCINNWKDKKIKDKKIKDKKIFVFSFSVLKYGQGNQISEIFMHDLTEFISSHTNNPMLRYMLGKYSEWLNGASINLFGISLQFKLKTENRRILFEQISQFLKVEDKRIVVIIDDLDRISATEVNQILFTIKNSFNLPGISYVLCYDMDQICKHGNKDEIQKNVDFLQKFIQVKLSLFSEKEKILHALSDPKVFHTLFKENKNISNEEQGNENSIDEKAILMALDGIKKALSSENAYHYYLYLGNIRAIKRVMNTIRLLNIQLVDFPNYDFDALSLLNLLLLYLDYPSVFRRIYISETWSQEHIYTFVYDNKSVYDHKRKRKNSEYYKKELTEIKKTYPAAVFLVEQLFKIEDNSDKEKKDWLLNPKEKESLVVYLDLIVNQHSRSLYEQSTFYINLLDRYAQQQISLEETLAGLEKTQKYYMKLWITAAYRNELRFKEIQVKEMIDYILNHRNEYSYQSRFDGRVKLVHVIIMLLGKRYYEDNGKFPYKNREIELFKKRGIIDRIAGKGILEFYDLMYVRLQCCADYLESSVSQETFSNIINMIGKFQNESFEYGGDTKICTIEQMRVFSQRCFQIFKERYIDTKKNFFKDIDALNFDDISGDSFEDVDMEELSRFKIHAKCFLMYQLGNNQPQQDEMPCGFYDTSGADDDNGIRQIFSQYMVSTVFAETDSFINFLRVIFDPQKNILPYILLQRICEFVDLSCLLKWWENNRERIKSQAHISDIVFSYGDKKISFSYEVRRCFEGMDFEIERGKDKKV